MAHDKNNEDNVETDLFQKAEGMTHCAKMHLVPVLALQKPKGRKRKASLRLGVGKARLVPISFLLT